MAEALSYNSGAANNAQMVNLLKGVASSSYDV